jgi:beta-glucosidase
VSAGTVPSPETGTAAVDAVESRLGELSLEEKVLLLGGHDFWHTNAVDRLGIGPLRLSDGPSGVRGPRSVGTTSVAFPCGAAIGATFDGSAAAELAAALADECADRGVHVLLGPTANLQRHPLGGRNFECFSEDPVLSAVLATAYIEALQSRGVAAAVKHFVANDTEYERRTISSDVSETVLRELYEVPFEAAVRDAGAWAVMSAYNRVNGVFATEHAGLLTETLRADWGFDGVVISDWFATESTVPSVLAGLDLEMPGPPLHFGGRLLEAVEAGEVPGQLIDDHVRHLLLLAFRTGRLSVPAKTTGPVASRSNLASRLALARRLASSAFVLLENHDVLPLDLAPGSTLAVIGPNAHQTAAQGGGSARVNPARLPSIRDALERRLAPLGVEVVYELGCVTWQDTPVLEGDYRLEYFAGSGFDSEDFDGTVLHIDTARDGAFTWLGEPVPGIPALHSGGYCVRCSTTITPDVDGDWGFSLTQVGRARLTVGGQLILDEGADSPRSRAFFGLGSEEMGATIALEAGKTYDVVVEYAAAAGVQLGGLRIGAVPPIMTDEELMWRAEALATSADAVVCVIGSPPDWECEGHDRPSMQLPGPQDQLVSRLVLANPRLCVLVNTGAPVTMDWAAEVGALAQIWFGGEQGDEAVVDVLLGDTDPGGRLPTTIPVRIEDTPAFPNYPGEDGHAPYREGLLVGYRHYEAAGVEPRYCFGYGLSYSTSDLSDWAVTVVSPLPAGELAAGLQGSPVVTVSVTVTNTGPRRASEVVQCYVQPADRQEDEPMRELRATAKVTLDPGMAERVLLALPARAFARYEPERGGFVASPGEYEVSVGRSLRDLPLRAVVPLGR